MTRLPEQPGERIERAAPLSFTFDGKPVPALAGDTIASALYAAGQRTFARSFKYHRRRGLLCCAGQCANCMVAVDGRPGVRACTEPVAEGMAVEHLNARPGLDFDVMRATDLVGSRLTPPGFYYKTFIRPRRLWPLYEKVLRHAAGLGRLRKRQDEREWRTEYRRRHADVLVVGGGAAGLHAAIAAAEAGADVVLADESPAPGGRMLFDGRHALAAELTERARAAGVELLERASALGCFDGLVPVAQGSTLHQVRAARHVFATGTIEQPLVFAGNDLPGVMLADAARRLIAQYAIRPGARVVVATTGDRGLAAAQALRAAGAQLVAVADLRAQPSALARELRDAGVTVLHGSTVVEASGRRELASVVLAPLDGAGGDAAERTFACDLLLVSGGAAPASSLALQAGASSAWDADAGCFRLDELPASAYAAGSLAGHDGPVATAVSGELAGLEAALALGHGAPAARERAAALAQQLGALAREAASAPAPAPAVAGGGRGKCFSCLCEDVTAKDVKLAIGEGYDSIELAKRYTTTTMGPCQGRMCQLPTARLIARETGQELAAVGSTTARPPWTTVPLGALAGRPFEPAKRSSLHARQRALGATVRWAGDWRRAYDYGDPEGEALAVGEAVGIIDVSTLGKLLVRGPDAGELLDRLYPNRLSNLKPGRTRYGVLTSEAGRITDDGVICRLDEQTFLVTATSSGAEAVERWFTWWLAVWELDVSITDVTQALGAVNVAGPQARALIGRLTDLDVSPQAFEYLDCKQATVAGVPCLLVRIGFVGELGYELHFLAPHGPCLWDRLLEAGADLGVRPFGLEPQRILRLQKLHIIVGQDTDSESTPYGAAMPWAVKLDKQQDFIGRWALEHAAQEAGESALVGFRVAGGALPAEGAAVLDAAGRPAGQVTSARRSPRLRESIGMAWVPAALAHDGARIAISDAGRTLEGTVTTQPFYDPEGAAVRA